jgi:hypothetical protein
LICVCGDIGFLGNWCRVLGKDGIKINTMLHSNTLRASGNRLEEAKKNVGVYNDLTFPTGYSPPVNITRLYFKISLFTRSEKMNHTTDNQGNNCIIARNNSGNNYLIDRDNLVLTDYLCNSLKEYL